MMEFLIVLIILIGVYKLLTYKDKETDIAIRYKQINDRNVLLDKRERDIDEKINVLKQIEEAANKIENSGFKDTSIFAKLYADQKKAIIDLNRAKMDRGSIKAIEHINALEYALNKSNLERKEYEYTIAKYEQLFPWIKEFKNTDLSLATRGFYEKKNLPLNVWQEYENTKVKIEQLKENAKKELQAEKLKAQNYIKDIENTKENIQKEQTEIEFKNKALNAKIKDVPVLVKYFSELEKKKDELREQYLLYKKRPAINSTLIVKEIKDEKKILIEKLKTAEYKCLYYENLIPWLADMEDEPLDIKTKEAYISKDASETDDAAKYWLSPEEYSALSDIEKYQMALDRYCNRNKTNAEIGRDYERYIGYRYECNGYKVEYRGIIDGFEDRGRDLICTKGESVLVVQCKCWSAKKEIHENHINQLFGTTVRFYLEKHHNGTFGGFLKDLLTGKITPVFITSTVLSNTAKSFAKSLNIKVAENLKLGKYPMIKCNINRTTKEKIYHLPFDQQYDNVKIGDTGEFFAMTVQEAEDAGFRRAKRWHENDY